jgi:aryl-alcohol dehydrogenase-like predicted oxidoreductase
MTIGEQGKNGVRTYDPRVNQQILDVFFAHGHKELDTARVYGEGTTESVRQAFYVIRIACTQAKYSDPS